MVRWWCPASTAGASVPSLHAATNGRVTRQTLLAPPPPSSLAPGRTPTFSIMICTYQAAATSGGAMPSLSFSFAPVARVRRLSNIAS